MSSLIAAQLLIFTILALIALGVFIHMVMRLEINRPKRGCDFESYGLVGYALHDAKPGELLTIRLN